jgi:hypothetical protein
MTKFTKLAVATLLGLAVVSTTASADAAKGQKIYGKNLKKACGINGAKFAAKHTQDEWESIKGAGKFAAEVAKICNGATYKPKYESNLYDFAYKFASDSGNVPSC